MWQLTLFPLLANKLNPTCLVRNETRYFYSGAESIHQKVSSVICFIFSASAVKILNSHAFAFSVNESLNQRIGEQVHIKIKRNPQFLSFRSSHAIPIDVKNPLSVKVQNSWNTGRRNVSKVPFCLSCKSQQNFSIYTVDKEYILK